MYQLQFTLFIFVYVHKIIPNLPVVISPPLCNALDKGKVEGSINFKCALKTYKTCWHGLDATLNFKDH